MYNFHIFYTKNNVRFRLDVVNAVIAEDLFDELAIQLLEDNDTQLTCIEIYHNKTGELLEVLYRD